MQVLNKLSLGGAYLECSCTVVLALAEHWPEPINNLYGGTNHRQSSLIGVQIVQEGLFAFGTHVTEIVHL